MKGFIGELIGTCVLIVLGSAVAAGGNLNKTFAKKTGNNWFYITFSWGVAVTMGVYVAGSLGSLGYLNPAITIAYAVFGFLPLKNVVPYLFGELLGAFFGAVIVVLQFYPHFIESKNEREGNSVAIFATKPAIKNNFFNFLSEFIATFFFTLILLNLGNFTKGLKPFIVGMLIFIIGAGLGTTTGFALNPARDFSPRLVYTIFPIPNKSKANWNYSWVPIFGPIFGAIFATWLEIIIK